MKVNEKVALELIALAVTCVVTYKEITLAKITAQKEIELARARYSISVEAIQ